MHLIPRVSKFYTPVWIITGHKDFVMADIFKHAMSNAVTLLLWALGTRYSHTYPDPLTNRYVSLGMRLVHIAA